MEMYPKRSFGLPDSPLGATRPAPEGSGFFRKAERFMRTRLFEIYVLLWSLPFGLVILTWFQVSRRPRHVRRLLRLWSGGFIFGGRWIIGLDYRIEGREHLSGQPVVIVCNHQSYWESIALCALVPDVNVISKRAAMRIPVFGWGLRHAPMIPVDRDLPGGNLRRIAREAVRSMASGRSILIFPEGTRVKPGARRRFERGLAHLCRGADVSIVPVVHNAGLFWPPGFANKHPGIVTMRILPAIPANGDPKQLSAHLERCMNREKDQLPGIGHTDPSPAPSAMQA